MRDIPEQTASLPVAPIPVVLEGYGVRLSPMGPAHAEALERAAADGSLWQLHFTSAPAPGEAERYIAQALDGLAAGHMLPFVVTETDSGNIIGTTRYHDIVAQIARLEIGYTWYAASWQRTHVNTACKLLLLRHAFETLGAQVVGWRTDILNHRSQNAIARLGARRDGVLRHHALRRDGTVRDTVMFSLLRAEWPEVQERLLARLAAGRGDAQDVG